MFKTIVLGLALLTAPHQPRTDPSLSDLIRDRIEAARQPAVDQEARIPIAGAWIHSATSLPRFYERREYAPAWVDADLSDARALLRAIGRADRDGLRPDDYHLAAIEGLLQRAAASLTSDAGAATDELVDLELLLTDAFLIFGSHLMIGRVEPTAIEPIWIASRRNVDMVTILEGALATGFIEETLYELLPPYTEYRALRDALIRYRRVQREGGWPRIEQGGTMRQGDQGAGVSQLRARLAATRDLDPRLQRGDLYDDDVARAVRLFQRRHGLAETGIVDLQTLTELTAPIERRIDQLIVNMERWRWLPQQLGARHARVNIAAFDFSVYEEAKPVMRMRAMVGHQYRATPVFSDTITLVVFAPWWGVPRSIAVQDIVPRIREEGVPYLERNRIQVWTTDLNPKRIDPRGVDWAAIDTAAFRYRFRQEPGPTNPLGNVKFLFPNSFDVYVHDTPAPEMFELAERAFSSGCIRIERPEEFAEYLLQGASGWDRARIERAMAATAEATVRVPDPLPIHILYWTAFADDDGRLNFRNDIYLRDEALERALETPAPDAARAASDAPATGV